MSKGRKSIAIPPTIRSKDGKLSILTGSHWFQIATVSNTIPDGDYTIWDGYTVDQIKFISDQSKRLSIAASLYYGRSIIRENTIALGLRREANKLRTSVSRSFAKSEITKTQANTSYARADNLDKQARDIEMGFEPITIHAIQLDYPTGYWRFKYTKMADNALPTRPDNTEILQGAPLDFVRLARKTFQGKDELTARLGIVSAGGKATVCFTTGTHAMIADVPANGLPDGHYGISTLSAIDTAIKCGYISPVDQRYIANREMPERIIAVVKGVVKNCKDTPTAKISLAHLRKAIKSCVSADDRLIDMRITTDGLVLDGCSGEVLIQAKECGVVDHITMDSKLLLQALALGKSVTEAYLALPKDRDDVCGITLLANVPAIGWIHLVVCCATGKQGNAVKHAA